MKNTNKKNKYEKMAERGVAFRSPRFKRIGLVGKHAKDYNDEISRDILDITLDQCGLDVDVVGDGIGGKQNVIVNCGAKKVNGKYEEKDIHGRFSDCQRLNTFVNGMYRGMKISSKRKRY